MSSEIHPTAIVENGAQIENGATIGAYAYIGPNVKIGAGSIIHHHATVDGFTEMGQDNVVFPYAFIGAKSQDLKFDGGRPGLKIGNRNTFREYTSLHLGTKNEECTTIGSDNFILAYAHIAHDCIVGNHLILSSHSALGGHAIVGDHVNIGWNSGVHQFCRIGSYAMIGATSKVTQDIVPYMIADGRPATVRTINKIGLERKGFDDKELETVRILYKRLYREGLNKTQALEKLNNEFDADNKVFSRFRDFLSHSKRGLA